MNRLNDDENRRIDWVGQTHHRQPQDPIPNIRSRQNHRAHNHPSSGSDSDVQVQQQQQQQDPILIKGLLDEFLKQRQQSKNAHVRLN